ncbi:hypothetical protein LPB72_08850 [Hydrogenophaga crassostreae]|uniref:DUF4189 domain-containing protein n=1 Tax=Hydrogenophaga crassostreae TaxID=1763535 RepID=A0A167I7T4_9BURK|nr:DUF4189 domain-containing protein [Hydrogenophaga crassostreae]AOW11835.1 hypothetical protein LPB072_02100 [Hydrogenophaga crassostreae]OAD42317.1 hypothetical protein LPB72_08850 [Hydrogenophaga crassostreae]
MNISKWSLWLAAALTALAVTACGGGSTGNGYGSIAVSNSAAAVAIVTEGLTQSIANESARDKCDEDDCEVVLQFEQCGAVSASLNSVGAQIITASEGGTAFAAQTSANEACTKQGGVACAAIPNLPAQCN